MKKAIAPSLLGFLLAVPLFLGSCTSTKSTSAETGVPANVGRDGVAIDGYDPVSYFDGTPQEGSEAHAFTYRGVIYRFASEENSERFQENPDHYVPAYGGWCAYAMLDGEKVKINPERYKIVDGKNYLFYDEWGTNTLKLWDGLTEEQPESELIRRADEHWESLTAAP